MSVKTVGTRRRWPFVAGAALALTPAVPTPAQCPSLWQQVAPVSPQGRDGLRLAYDSARARVVLFGGRDGGGAALADTSEWNGQSWSVVLGPAPPARSFHAMAYDVARGRTVLFGGLSATSTNLGDTWVWNGAVWAQLAPATSPPVRALAAMAYDSARARKIGRAHV